MHSPDDDLGQADPDDLTGETRPAEASAEESMLLYFEGADARQVFAVIRDAGTEGIFLTDLNTKSGLTESMVSTHRYALEHHQLVVSKLDEKRKKRYFLASGPFAELACRIMEGRPARTPVEKNASLEERRKAAALQADTELNNRILRELLQNAAGSNQPISPEVLHLLQHDA